jgi:hypothetical protein
MILLPAVADHRLLPEARAHDPVVLRYRACFALLDWGQVPERDARRAWPGRPPHPPAAYIKALLVKLCEHKAYITELRTFLVEHPLLVLELGFRPVLDPTQPSGFAVERTAPCDRYLRHWQQTLDPALLQSRTGFAFAIPASYSLRPSRLIWATSSGVSRGDGSGLRAAAQPLPQPFPVSPSE